MSTLETLLKVIGETKGLDERLQGLTERHEYAVVRIISLYPLLTTISVYPAIDPQAAFTSKSFAGKVVLITGASRGLGSVIATFYARAGAKLALVARSASKLDDTEKKIQQEWSTDVITFVLDVKDTQAAAKAIQDTVDHFGRIDVVIPNAGVAIPPDGKGKHCTPVICQD